MQPQKPADPHLADAATMCYLIDYLLGWPNYGEPKIHIKF